MGQSLTLESTITTVKGITSRVDIVWRSNVELKRITNANTSLTINDSELYKDTLNIPLLSTNDDDRVFQCEMIIMTTPSIIVTTNNITLDVTGKYCRLCYWQIIRHNNVQLCMYNYLSFRTCIYVYIATFFVFEFV